MEQQKTPGQTLPAAFLEIPAATFSKYEVLIGEVQQRFADVEVERSLEISEPRIYITSQRRLFVGSATIQALDWASMPGVR